MEEFVKEQVGKDIHVKDPPALLQVVTVMNFYFFFQVTTQLQYIGRLRAGSGVPKT